MGGIQRWPGGRNTPFSLSVSPLAGTVRAVVLLPRPPPRPLVALSPEQTPPDDGTSVCVCVYVCVHTCMHVHVHVRKGGSKIVKWEGWPGGRNTPFSLSVSPLAGTVRAVVLLPRLLVALSPERTPPDDGTSVCVCVRERERGSEIVKWEGWPGGTHHSHSQSPLLLEL